VADDLTGACDTGALFAARGPVAGDVWPDPPLHAPVTVVDTEIRTLDPVDAARRVSGVARNLARTRFFKKIDSTLRGPIGAELDALLRATVLPRRARVSPPCPPSAASSSSACCSWARSPSPRRRSPRIRPSRARPARRTSWTCCAPSSTGRSPGFPSGACARVAARWAARLVRLAGMVIVADAETRRPTSTRSSRPCSSSMRRRLLVGAAGLALALARRLGLATARVDPPAGERWLIVAGSQHPATRRQVEAAREAGLMVLATPDTPQADRAGAVAELAAQAPRPARRRAHRRRDRHRRRDARRPPITRSAPSVWTSRAPRVRGWRSAGCAHRAASRWPSSPRPGGFGEPDLFVNLVREAVA